jgi:hypothetical protein
VPLDLTLHVHSEDRNFPSCVGILTIQLLKAFSFSYILWGRKGKQKNDQDTVTFPRLSFISAASRLYVWPHASRSLAPVHQQSSTASSRDRSTTAPASQSTGTLPRRPQPFYSIPRSSVLPPGFHSNRRVQTLDHGECGLLRVAAGVRALLRVAAAA